MTDEVIIWWPKPPPGDIVWCRFPDSMKSPRPKPRPALILNIYDEDPEHCEVEVGHATKQDVNDLHAGEFSILSRRDPAAYEAAGLSYDSKFCLQSALTLPYNSVWFFIPPGAPHGQTPKLGTLHASMFRAAALAYQAASKKKR